LISVVSFVAVNEPACPPTHLIKTRFPKTTLAYLQSQSQSQAKITSHAQTTICVDSCSHDWVLHPPQRPAANLLFDDHIGSTKRSENRFLAFNSCHPQPGPLAYPGCMWLCRYIFPTRPGRVFSGCAYECAGPGYLHTHCRGRELRDLGLRSAFMPQGSASTQCSYSCVWSWSG
jgi:hypothetical protein